MSAVLPCPPHGTYGVHTSRIPFENPAFAPPAPQTWGEKYKISGYFPPELGG
jgi:hypothetical protein